MFKYLIVLLLFSGQVFGQVDEVKAQNGKELPSYIPKVREHFTVKENLVNFGAVYAAQWTYYLIGQREQLDDHGSFKNWTNNMFSPHFDKDSFDYNLFKHTLTGNYYYLWFRSRGHTRENAFWWSFLSSLAFEFTVENATERPSWQDIYQTPVFGTVAGIGVEKLSRYFHARDTWWGHGLGYLLNPFTLVPQSKEQLVSGTPLLDHKSVGYTFTYRY